MLQRVNILRAASYYTKYGIARNATDKEIKKAINAFTVNNAFKSPFSAPLPRSPKSRLGLVAIFAARDQFAKYILIYQRQAYNIWVDERNLGKALATALYSRKTSSPRKIKIKEEKIAKKSSNERADTYSADYLNKKLAEEQKAAWSGGQVEQKPFFREKEEKTRDESKTNNSNGAGKSVKGDTILTGEVEQEPILPKGLGVVLSAGLLLSLRSPLGKRFLAPFLTALLIPFATVLYYLFEDGRTIPEQSSKESIIEIRRKRREREESISPGE